MDHEQLQENLSLYALGTLEPDSAQEVEAHLATGCPNCGTLLLQYRATSALLPCALPPQNPPADMKAKIFATLARQAAPMAAAVTDIPPAGRAPSPPAPESLESTLPLPPAKTDIPTAPAGLTPDRPSPWTAPVSHDRPAEPSPLLSRRRSSSPPGRPAWLPQALAAALGGLLAGGGLYAYYQIPALRADRPVRSEEQAALAQANLTISDLERRLAARQLDLDKARAESDRAIAALRTTHDLLAKHQEQLEILQTARPGKSTEEILRIFSSPYAQMASLSGTGMAKDAYALVFVEPNTRRGFFYANNLPALPSGKAYQLWVITDKPVSAGVFTLDHGRKGRVMLQGVPDIGKIKQFAVSLEPAGGKPQPTGDIYLAGAL